MMPQNTIPQKAESKVQSIEGLEIFHGCLNTEKIYKNWHDFAARKNLGASGIFTGIVRMENGFDGLSFDIYQPLLEKWFLQWSEKAMKLGGFLKMAHSIGHVYNHQSSYMAGVFSSQRQTCFNLFESFIQDFKHNAPIWKYDLKGQQRIYAKERSYKLPFSGLLS